MDAANTQRGFTLIELTVVIVVMGIIALVAIVSWPRFAVFPDAQASLLANDLRYTQNLAMSRGQRFRLVKISSTTYQILDSSGTAITLPAGNNVVTFGSGLTFGAWSNLPNNLVAFNTKGEPCVDIVGTQLNDTASITITSSAASAVVTIAPETGWVLVQ